MSWSKPSYWSSACRFRVVVLLKCYAASNRFSTRICFFVLFNCDQLCCSWWRKYPNSMMVPPPCFTMEIVSPERFAELAFHHTKNVACCVKSSFGLIWHEHHLQHVLLCLLHCLLETENLCTCSFLVAPFKSQICGVHEILRSSWPCFKLLHYFLPHLLMLFVLSCSLQKLWFLHRSARFVLMLD